MYDGVCIFFRCVRVDSEWSYDMFLSKQLKMIGSRGLTYVNQAG